MISYTIKNQGDHPVSLRLHATFKGYWQARLCIRPSPVFWYNSIIYKERTRNFA